MRADRRFPPNYCFVHQPFVGLATDAVLCNPERVECCYTSQVSSK